MIPVINKNTDTAFKIDSIILPVISAGNPDCCSKNSLIKPLKTSFVEIRILMELMKNKLHRNKLT
jgi:hypothetical protein